MVNDRYESVLCIYTYYVPSKKQIIKTLVLRFTAQDSRCEDMNLHEFKNLELKSLLIHLENSTNYNIE